MAARSGMAQLIADVRLMADAGESEHSVGGRTYYTDDDIQRYLDQHRENIYREYLRNEPEYGSGSAEYHYYYFRYAHVEGTASGSLAWLITDGNDSAHNSTGNPGMATGGCGDVLTGVITALVCQGLAPFDAARLGVYVHGLAGDLAAAELGQVAMIASDLLRFLPQAFRSLK